jgi:hypothetical protein
MGFFYVQVSDMAVIVVLNLACPLTGITANHYSVVSTILRVVVVSTLEGVVLAKTVI